MFTIYGDADSQGRKIQFYPRSGGGETIKILMYVITPAEPNQVPDRLQEGLELYIARAAYPLGHPGRTAAFAEIQVIVPQLIQKDKVDQSDLTFLPDESTLNVHPDNPYGAPWHPL